MGNSFSRDVDEETPDNTLEIASADRPDGLYYHSTQDVYDVKDILMLRGLPIELVDIIIDTAEYWVCSHVAIESTLEAGGFSSPGDVLYLRSLPIGLKGSDTTFNVHMGDVMASDDYQDVRRLYATDPNEEEPCPLRPRKINIKISSHDQGWGGNPDHPHASWSWFDLTKEALDIHPEEDGSFLWPARIFQYDPDDDPLELGRFGPSYDVRPYPTDVKLNMGSDFLVHNPVAQRQWTEHDITLHYLDSEELANTQEGKDAALEQSRGWKTTDGTFVRDLKVGDTLTLWARARFPGWANNVRSASITAFWAI